MHAIRLARGYTQRDVIVKIDGCYRGAHDAVLVEAEKGKHLPAGSVGFLNPQLS